MWRDLLSYREMRHFISEGRSQWGRTQARSGLDFVRAVATLGVDRSIDEFVRYLISARNGQDVMAVPVGRYKVSDRVQPESELLRQIDPWVERAKRSKVPDAVMAALNSVDRAQFDAARFGGPIRLQRVLAALADCEQAVSRSPGYRKKSNLEPISGLSAREWLPRLADRSAEFRIALGLVSLRDRPSKGSVKHAAAVRGSLATLLRPVVLSERSVTGRNLSRGLQWSTSGSRVAISGRQPLFEVLQEVVGIRAVLAASRLPASGHRGQEHREHGGSDHRGHGGGSQQSDHRYSEQRGSRRSEHVPGLPFAFDQGLRIDIADIGRLLCGQLDEALIGSMLKGLLMLDWENAFREGARIIKTADDLDAAKKARMHATAHPLYVMLAPFFAGRLPVAPTEAEPKPHRSIPVKPRPEWVGAIRSGAARSAANSAARLLRGHGWQLIADDFDHANTGTGVLSASLLLRPCSASGQARQIRFLLTVRAAFHPTGQRAQHRPV